MSAVPRWVTWTRRALIGAGVLALAYAASGILGSRDTRFAYGRFLVLVWVGHDLLVLPLALAVGVVIGQFVPVGARAIVQAAIFASAVLTVVALPAVLGYGRAPDLPSALPRNYGRGLLIVLGLIWLAAGAALTIQTIRRRRHAASPPA
jgi:hypothetical protein